MIDDCNREALEHLKEEVGTPKYIRCDNGPEFISKLFMNWCENNFIEIKYTQPGKLKENGYIERINRFITEDILDAYYFNDIYQLQKISDKWREDHNFNHLHKSLGNKSPKEYMPPFNNNYLSNFRAS